MNDRLQVAAALLAGQWQAEEGAIEAALKLADKLLAAAEVLSPTAATDSARYRWLRARWLQVVSDTEFLSGGMRQVRSIVLRRIPYELKFDEASLDAAVDTAMAAPEFLPEPAPWKR
jgi:hypothetical protein